MSKKKRDSSSRKPSRGEANGAVRPIKRTGKNIAIKRDEGPASWFLPVVESAYTRLAPHDTAPPPPPSTRPAVGEAFKSSLQPGKNETVLAQVSPTAWLE